MRERPANVGDGTDALRITPAYAGKTSGTSRTGDKHQDHPRVCGKDCVIRLFWFRCLWITPAYAGKTKRGRSRSGTLRDHPRVCGKDTDVSGASNFSRGSPPRMRERLQFFQSFQPFQRITPAYAGKTIKYLYLLYRQWDHPRVCGKDLY